MKLLILIALIFTSTTMYAAEQEKNLDVQEVLGEEATITGTLDYRLKRATVETKAGKVYSIVDREKNDQLKELDGKQVTVTGTLSEGKKVQVIRDVTNLKSK